MKKFKVKIEPDAMSDIQDIKKWYNGVQKGLGKRFRSSVIKQIYTLESDPYIYAVRYKEIRCMIIHDFPYMVHFYLNEFNNTVEVLAVISTHRDPDIWDVKTTLNG